MENKRTEKFMSLIKSPYKTGLEFLKWLVIASIIGGVCGVIGSVFHMAVSGANELRGHYPWLLFLMPVAGIIIVALYRFSSMNESKGTDDILDSVRGKKEVPLRMAPLIFIATALTHLTGGSAGREGAALQLGGSIGYKISRIFKVDEKSASPVIMCGMSAVFSALFGTPLTASIFAMEVTAVGIMHYSALIPCVVSSVIAYGITLLFGLKPTHYSLAVVPDFGAAALLQTAALAILCAILSIVFCELLHKTAHTLKKTFKNEYIRALVGSAVIIGLTLLLRTTDYNGAGEHVLKNAINGTARPEAFVLKMIFTAITIGAGFKGGEIVPTFFVGATFGCLVSGIIGLDPGFGAAVGMVAMFCGMLNCPIASIILSVEIFGSQGLLFFAIAAAISYMLSGYHGLYHSQRIVYSKTKAEYIDKNIK